METYNIHRYNSVGRPRACLALSPSFTLIAYTFDRRHILCMRSVACVETCVVFGFSFDGGHEHAYTHGPFESAP